jgi:thioredoxin reductase/SAM-dependent methyltransferase
MTNTYDVVIIGGGAAGLSGALALGRARRSVLVIDAGDPRNQPADHVHNYLGREGTPPDELLAIGRQEVEQYGVEVRQARASSATKQHDGTFVVALDDGTVRARRLLVTTGLVDDLPDVAGVAQQWGKNVLHCPYCHGWEVRDRAIGVLGTSPASYHQAQLFRQWSEDITLFVHTAPVPTDAQLEELAARGIRVVDGEVAGWEDDGVRLASGELVGRDALVVAPVFRARAEIIESLGLPVSTLEVDGHVMGTYVAADPNGATDVPGVWVAGNVADLKAQVVGAAAAGLMAGAQVNYDLILEETQHAVALRREFSQDAWEERYGAADGTLWSGKPNAVLVTEASELTPGTALDVGCGEGGDALWLAGRGWQVTGTDISTVALARAAAHAKERGLDVDWQQVDLLVDPPPPSSYDLVTAHFMQLPPPERVELYAHLAAAVVPGGTLLLVAHHPVHLETVMGNNHDPRRFFTAEDLVEHLDPQQWDVVVADARERIGKGPEGVDMTFTDTVVRARRR